MGKLASVGSINLDNRSFYHHFECGTLLYDCKAIEDVKKDMMDTFGRVGGDRYSVVQK